jgi:hypothetical protein
MGGGEGTEFYVAFYFAGGGLEPNRCNKQGISILVNNKI